MPKKSINRGETAQNGADPGLAAPGSDAQVASDAPRTPRTHCRRGHELAGENVKVRKHDGFRVCLECERLRCAARRGDFAARVAIENERGDRRRQSLSRDRSARLRRKYGLTAARFDELLDAQNGACAACGLELVLDQVNAEAAACVDQRGACVDQADSGAIRGIVCRRCSGAIARLHGDADLAAKLAAYLAGGARC